MSGAIGRLRPPPNGPADRAQRARAFVSAVSLEVSAKAMPALRAEAARMAQGATISIPYLPSEDDTARLAAARTVRELGFEPMPHLSARRIGSRAALEHFIDRAVIDAGVERCLVIAGDLSTPAGPFADSASIIESGVLERAGIKVVGVGGHPQGHPVMTSADRWRVLERKCQRIEARGMAPLVITQFAFDADVVLTWLNELRARGITHPVLVGIPGPASIARLVRYAAMCGVSASTSMLSRYGVSLGRLLGSAGPDVFVDRLVDGLTEAHGQVSPHLFPFGGIAQSMEWVEHYRMRAGDECLAQMSVQLVQTPDLPLRCPCCGHRTLDERGTFRICAVCFWEDDGQDDYDADVVRDGPNGCLSLTQGRANYKAFGASQMKDLPYVRLPFPHELP